MQSFASDIILMSYFTQNYVLGSGKKKLNVTMSEILTDRIRKY